MIVIFSVTAIAIVTSFIVWQRPIERGLFFLIWTVGLLIVFFIGWAVDWFTPLPDECNLTLSPTSSPADIIPEAWKSGTPVDSTNLPCYGEAMAANGIYQPSSTLSDLAFITAGLFIALYASVISDSRSRSDSPVLPVGNSAAVKWDQPVIWLLVFTVIFMGPGSMYLHASLRNWAGWTDSFSVYNFALFAFAYGVYRFTQYLSDNEGLAWTLSITLYLVTAIGAGLLGWFFPGSRDTLFYISFPLWGVMELVVLITFYACTNNGNEYRRGSYAIGWGWFIVFAILFVVALVFKLGVEGSGKFETSWQPHSWFHILAATAIPLVFVYWTTEQKPERTNSGGGGGYSK